jgi:hypothetical protein
MYNTINRILTVIAITAFGMISAPTLSTMNSVFAISPFSIEPFKSLGIDKILEGSTKNNDNNAKSNDNRANSNDNNNQPKSNDNNAKSNDKNNQPKSNDKNNQPKSGNSHAGEKCGANGGNTKDWYCKGTHHHCAKGQNDCLLEGGRT